MPPLRIELPEWGIRPQRFEAAAWLGWIKDEFIVVICNFQPGRYVGFWTQAPTMPDEEVAPEIS